MLNVIMLSVMAPFFVRTTQPGPNVIKHFTVVIYERSQKARLSLPAKPFQLRLMFEGRLRLTPKY
jgi:hypothetical protein